jgi:hypothetical protein
MSSTSNRARVLAALICGVLLAACDDAPEQQSASAGTATPRPASKIGGLTPDMVAAVSSGKSATMISVHFVLRSPPTIGKSLPVDIAIVPHVDFKVVRVLFEARDGVKLRGGGSLGPLNDAPAEKPISHHLELMPETEGVYMVTASVDTEGDEGSITRIFSIPVIVGPPAAAAETPTIPAATPAEPVSTAPVAPPAS